MESDKGPFTSDERWESNLAAFFNVSTTWGCYGLHLMLVAGGSWYFTDSFRECKRVLEPNLGQLNQQYNHIIIFGLDESYWILCPGIRVTLILRYLEGRPATIQLHGLRKVWLRVALLFLKSLGKVILNGIKLPGIWANVSPLGES